MVASLKGCMGSDSVPIQINDDVFGLIVFKADLIDPSSNLSSWNEDDDSPCSWKFIECNPVSGRVSQVSLDGLGLSGRLGKGLQKLQHMKTLSLSRNNFSGDISLELGFLSNLERLNLSHNSLSGLIPSFLDSMSSIKFLDLSENSFSGKLPDDLFRNSLSLRYLSLAGNLLRGPVPSSLLSCSSLNTINLSNNHFSGDPDFSRGIWSLKRLRKLDLSHNEFSGSVPQGASAIHNLKELQLQGNRFSGSLPGDIGLCPHLNRLDLSSNRFSGALPESLQRLSSMNFFSLSKNMLAGEFPQWIGSLTNLEYLDLSSNGLTGSIPSSIGDLKSLRYLSLSNNKLFGIIPTSMASCTMLSVIRLRSNSFNGSIPEGLFDLGLEEVDIFTQWIGHIPAEKDICESGSLNILQLDGNSLMGQIPEEIGNCSSLYLLSLAQNNLSGSIPESISRLNKLKILKLEFNELTGEIPQELGILENLLAVNISYNKLVGRLPVGGIFPSLDQSALQGNLGICSPLLKGPCKMNVPKPLVLDPYAYGNQGDGKKPRKVSSHPARFHHHMFLSISTIIAISAAIFILFGVILISLLNLSVRKRLAFVDHAMESMCSSSSRSGILSTGKLVLFDSKSSPDWISNPEALLNKAAEIGQGVFGTVYKVSLGSEARMVAIKKLFTPNIIQYPEDFDREVQVLGKARHPNLLSLKGYYWTPQLQLLVSEYAPNGSLQAKLHERIPSTPRMGDYPEDEVLPVLKLALVCTSHIPSSRPSMAEVVQILQVIKTPVPQRTEFF
ncbi:hypothetical protein OIU84_012139 [Salix udensis]|uniref:Protein kinase domain-containing protein n=1 Tax=Salix udensis TaxID=889485 RepID=A0AAD6JGA3_9ROSI|nr:hypothetical protein OIU84_012139 [Salix udensis]